MREAEAELSDKVAVYAVLRFDLFLGENVPLPEIVTVKEIVPSPEEAEAEVRRLNASVDPARVVYAWQPTRYFPSGRRVADRDPSERVSE